MYHPNGTWGSLQLKSQALAMRLCLCEQGQDPAEQQPSDLKLIAEKVVIDFLDSPVSKGASRTWKEFYNINHKHFTLWAEGAVIEVLLEPAMPKKEEKQ
tara:strand:- start:184 stop:480 length:297 start_codon:yes stop_codon:yes gene_type:complete